MQTLEGAVAENAPGSGRRSRRAWIWLAVGGVLAVAGATVFAMAIGGEDEDVSRPGGPREVSVGELRSAAAKADHPVYWAGATRAHRLELTANARGQWFVRYLPQGVPIGDRRPAFTTIGTYALARAYQRTERSGERPGAVRREAPGGGIAVWTETRPTSVYLSYPGSDLLVEVYDPDPARARALALAGRVRPLR